MRQAFRRVARLVAADVRIHSLAAQMTQEDARLELSVLSPFITQMIDTMNYLEGSS